MGHPPTNGTGPVEQAKSKRPIPTWMTSLFVYGAVLHFLLFRWTAHRTYSSGLNVLPGLSLLSFVFSIVGGGLFSFLMLRMLRRVSARNTITFTGAVMEAAVRGVVATSLTFETLFVSASVYLAIKSLAGIHLADVPAIPLIFLAAFVEVHTYGVILIAWSLRFSVLYGLLPGIVIWELRKIRDRRLQYSANTT